MTPSEMGSMNNWLGFSSSGADAVLHPLPQEWGGPKGVALAADEEPPKLEDFLGLQELAAEGGRSGAGSSGVGASSIGLSMIKNWLRSQPATALGGNAMALSMSSPADAEAGAGASPDGRGKVGDGAVVEAAPRKAVDTFGQRTSIYRGVTKHRWTGRYEAHLWDNSCRREGQTRKGRQVYLGGYDKEEKAARAYDLAALKYWGTTTTTNFPVSDYEKEIKEMKHMNRQEYVASLRRKSSGFSRGASIYRGVTRHHQHGRWQARIGRVAGNKDLYLGTFSTQEEAAEAYDIAAIKFRGLNAVTNFDMSRYDVKSIIESSTLPISGTTKRLNDVSEHTDICMDGAGTDADNVATSQLTNGIGSYSSHHYGYTGWSPIAMQPIPLQYPNGGQSRLWCKQEQDSAAFAAAQNLHNLHYFPAVGSTQNFFQPSAVPDVMCVVEVPSPSLDSSSYMYNGGIGYHGAVGVGSYGTTVATLMDQGQGNHASSGYGEDGVVGGGTTSHLSGIRSMYYLSKDSPVADVGRDDGYEQAVGCNSWVSSVPVMAQKANVTVCHGAPLFSVWNDA